MIWIWGWHVLEAIIKNRSRKIFRIQTLKKYEEKIFDILGDMYTSIEIVDKNHLDINYGKNHQGIAMQVSQINFLLLKDWLKKQGEKSVLIACDLLEDTHNLGAIIRTSRALGASGILVTKKKTAPFNGHLVKATAGGLESFDVIQVGNLATSLDFLRESGYTIYGLDHRGSKEWKVQDRSVIVLGQEGNGMRYLTKKKCDSIISIHTQKDFSVLNVSVAAGIIISKFLENNF